MNHETKRPVVVVAGGTGGVGRATVREFASSGNDVAFVGSRALAGRISRPVQADEPRRGFVTVPALVVSGTGP